LEARDKSGNHAADFFGCCCAFCFSSDCFPFFLLYCPFSPMHSSFLRRVMGEFVLCLMMLALVYSRIPSSLLLSLIRKTQERSCFLYPQQDFDAAFLLLCSLTCCPFGVRFYSIWRSRHGEPPIGNLPGIHWFCTNDYMDGRQELVGQFQTTFAGLGVF
jgi:hypothetical protein